MRILVLFTFLVSTTTFAQMGPEMMVKKWSKFKAMESCYGQDIMKTYMLKMKRAIAKCTKTEMPELDLPMFSSPYRAVQALLNGARDMESVNVARFQNLMKNVQSGNVPGAAQSSYIPIPVPVKQQQQTADPVDEIMRKLFLRKIIDKFSEKDRDDDDDDDFFNIEDGDFAELFFTKKSRGLPADAGLNRRTTAGRYKRQSDLYELGDRLSETLMEQKKELKIVDENMELDLENMLDDVKSMNIRDKWLED